MALMITDTLYTQTDRQTDTQTDRQRDGILPDGKKYHQSDGRLLGFPRGSPSQEFYPLTRYRGEPVPMKIMYSLRLYIMPALNSTGRCSVVAFKFTFAR